MEGEIPTPVSKWRTKVTNENPEILKKAQEELNENPEQRDRDVQTLRKMILGEDNLKSPTDDAFLLKFLRVRKFNIERAFKLLKQYYSVRTKFPSLFINYRPSSVLHLLTVGGFFTLPYRDQLGRTMFILRAGRWDPAKNTINDYLALMHMCTEYTLLEEETQVNGIVLIVDLKYFGFVHARQITPNTGRIVSAILQDCLPGRYKGFHVIFEPAIFSLVFMVIQPFLNKKIRSRIHFHGDNLKTLHQHVHPECLPEEYGGFQPPSEAAIELHLQGLLAHEDEIVNHIANSGYGVAKE